MAINQENINIDEATTQPPTAAPIASATVAAAAAAAAYKSAQTASIATDDKITGGNVVADGDIVTNPDEAAPETLADLEDKIRQLTAEIAEKNDRILRQQAEFQNFRRRNQKEKDDLGQVVTQELLKSLLPSLDNFERALAAETNDAAILRKGVEMIYQQFVDTLKTHGLKPIAAAGEQFDPNFHQAVMRVENQELPDNSIARELQRGYMVGEAVIRPSMVQVVANN